jgi:AcrR family transcriptional regulator
VRCGDGKEEGMEIPALITAAYRRLLNAMDYGQITIEDICKEASVSRKTLYKYFANKLAITVAIIYEDSIHPTEMLKKAMPADTLKSAPSLMLERSYQLMLDSRRAYENLLSGLGRAKLADLMLDVTLTFTRALFAKDPWKLPEDEREYAAYFVAAAQAMTKTRWIADGMRTPPAKMAKLTVTWLWAHQRELGL